MFPWIGGDRLNWTNRFGKVVAWSACVAFFSGECELATSLDKPMRSSSTRVGPGSKAFNELILPLSSFKSGQKLAGNSVSSVQFISRYVNSDCPARKGVMATGPTGIYSSPTNHRKDDHQQLSRIVLSN